MVGNGWTGSALEARLRTLTALEESTGRNVVEHAEQHLSYLRIIANVEGGTLTASEAEEQFRALRAAMTAGPTRCPTVP